MLIRFKDTGETFIVTGQRTQFWLFQFPDGRQGKAVKGADSYEILGEEDQKRIYPDIQVRPELTDFDL